MLLVEPPDEFRHAGQDLIAVIDHAVHIADEAALLVEVKCMFHVLLLRRCRLGRPPGTISGRGACRRWMVFF